MPLDIGVEAHEQQPRIFAVPMLVEAADAHDAVPVADRDLLGRTRHLAVARIGAADVGAERAADRLRVLGAEQEIVVGIGRRLPRRGETGGLTGGVGWVGGGGAVGGCTGVSAAAVVGSGRSIAPSARSGFWIFDGDS